MFPTGDSKIISAAVSHLPWSGEDGNPLTNVSAYADQMTYVNIMCVEIRLITEKPLTHVYRTM